MVQKTSQSGFTLIELLISMAIAGLLLSLMVLAFTSQSRMYNTQQEIITMQEDMWAALQLMSQDIRMAGYDPKGAAGSKIVLASATTFNATQDLNGDGVTTGANENVTYSLDSIKNTLARDSGGGNQPVVDNITQLAFIYQIVTNAGGAGPWTSTWTQTPGSSDLPNINIVKVCIQGHTNHPTSLQGGNNFNAPIAGVSWTPASPGSYQYRTMCVEVQRRNFAN